VISKVTLFSLLLALMLGVGIRLWYMQQNDACARYLAGDKSLPATQWVVTGTRTIMVPCSDWLTRQPEKVQLLCLVDLVLAVMFVLNALLDTRAWLQRRRRLRQAG